MKKTGNILVKNKNPTQPSTFLHVIWHTFDLRNPRAGNKAVLDLSSHWMVKKPLSAATPVVTNESSSPTLQLATAKLKQRELRSQISHSSEHVQFQQRFRFVQLSSFRVNLTYEGYDLKLNTVGKIIGMSHCYKEQFPRTAKHISTRG